MRGQTAIEPISPGQIKKVWFEARELGIPNDDLKEVIQILTGKKDLKQLTKYEGIVLIDLLLQNKMGGNARRGMATSRQLWKIEEYKKLLGWDEQRLKGYIKKYAHVEMTNWLDSKAASNIITGLKEIYNKQQAENAIESDVIK